MKKSNKNQKITKEDLKKFDTKRVIKDLNSITKIVNKIGNLNQDLDDKEANKLKLELNEIEKYLKGHYKDYFEINDKKINLKDLDINPDLEEDLDTEK